MLVYPGIDLQGCWSTPEIEAASRLRTPFPPMELPNTGGSHWWEEREEEGSVTRAALRLVQCWLLQFPLWDRDCAPQEVFKAALSSLAGVATSPTDAVIGQDGWLGHCN